MNELTRYDREGIQERLDYLNQERTGFSGFVGKYIKGPQKFGAVYRMYMDYGGLGEGGRFTRALTKIFKGAVRPAAVITELYTYLPSLAGILASPFVLTSDEATIAHVAASLGLIVGTPVLRSLLAVRMNPKHPNDEEIEDLEQLLEVVEDKERRLEESAQGVLPL